MTTFFVLPALAQSITVNGDHTVQTITRNIQPFHYLRPIPQGQLDVLNMSAEEKASYQNSGY